MGFLPGCEMAFSAADSSADRRQRYPSARQSGFRPALWCGSLDAGLGAGCRCRAAGVRETGLVIFAGYNFSAIGAKSFDVGANGIRRTQLPLLLDCGLWCWEGVPSAIMTITYH